jgi:hypothetical protein
MIKLTTDRRMELQTVSGVDCPLPHTTSQLGRENPFPQDTADPTPREKQVAGSPGTRALLLCSCPCHPAGCHRALTRARCVAWHPGPSLTHCPLSLEPVSCFLSRGHTARDLPEFKRRAQPSCVCVCVCVCVTSAFGASLL